MGQYHIIVNVTKRQFLDPHKFGCGLKLREFSNQVHGPQQALIVLLSIANGRGGGDLGTSNLSEEEKAMIGSWAGDKIYVAGDYSDPWFRVPKDLKGKEYTYLSNEKTVTQTFGKDEKGQKCNENLYSAARAFFEDISDKMIAIVAKGENGYHPWACIDLASNAWRDVPLMGIRPNSKPEKPAGGQEIFEKYLKGSRDKIDDIKAEMQFEIGYLITEKMEKAKEFIKLLKECTVQFEKDLKQLSDNSSEEESPDDYPDEEPSGI